jgi:acetyl esterase/lipase
MFKTVRFASPWICLLFSLVLTSIHPLRAEDPPGSEPAPIRIWKGTAPDSDSRHWPRPDYKEEWETPGQVLKGVTDPAIQVYLPEPQNNTGAAIVICPGGGYQNLWIAKEGWSVAKELQKRGLAAIVLKYRHYDKFAAVQDAHRAVRYARSQAKEWRINPEAVGIGGFSAGGHLAIHMAAQLGRTEHWEHDEIDGLSKRPDFLMLIYPSVYLPEGAVVGTSFPPAFFAAAANDTTTKPKDIISFFSTLLNFKVPAELHMYQRGGHGFGAGTPECNCASWMDLFRNWLEVRGLVSKPR